VTVGWRRQATGRLIVNVLDPRDGLGSAFSKNRSDNEVAALGSYLVAWDNVSHVSEDMSDFLARLVTGDKIMKRRLYTDFDAAEAHYRRTGVITGINIPTGLQADALDRLIPLHLTPPTTRLSERAIEEEWAAAHPRVLAGVLDDAVAMLAGTGDNPLGLRHGDYAEALWAIDPVLYEAYAHNIAVARQEMAAEDPFVQTILSILDDTEFDVWEGTAQEAVALGWRYRRGGWWPDSPRAFSAALSRAKDALVAVGVGVGDRTSNGRRLKRLWREKG